MSTVQPLDLADDATLRALHRLQRDAYAVEARLLGTESLPALRETVQELAACGETFLGSFDDALVGAVSYRREAGTVDIHRLVVAPAAFRRGVATALLDALDEREGDATRFVVATGAANAPARALYERRGFVKIGEKVVPRAIAIVEYERAR